MGGLQFQKLTPLYNISSSQFKWSWPSWFSVHWAGYHLGLLSWCSWPRWFSIHWTKIPAKATISVQVKILRFSRLQHRTAWAVTSPARWADSSWECRNQKKKDYLYSALYDRAILSKPSTVDGVRFPARYGFFPNLNPFHRGHTDKNGMAHIQI